MIFLFFKRSIRQRLWVVLWGISLLFPTLGVGIAAAAGPGNSGGAVVQTKTTVNDRTTGYGIDPSTACIDANGDGKITFNECNGRDWSWTSTDPQIPAPVNNQNGTGVSAGSSSATIGQTASQSVSSGPHLTVRYFNSPSATGTTATSGFNSSVTGAQRNDHNEYGFEIIVDKKTDPLEPYYQRFSIPYTTVNSQTDANGNMVGSAAVTYEKVVTEMDPGNPGVFNRYTVAGTATSSWNGNTGKMEGSFSSTCQSGCPQDVNGFVYDPETGWTHPWQ